MAASRSEIFRVQFLAHWSHVEHPCRRLLILFPCSAYPMNASICRHFLSVRCDICYLNKATKLNFTCLDVAGILGCYSRWIC
jgi:hypothetical protein